MDTEGAKNCLLIWVPTSYHLVNGIWIIPSDLHYLRTFFLSKLQFIIHKYHPWKKDLCWGWAGYFRLGISSFFPTHSQPQLGQGNKYNTKESNQPPLSKKKATNLNNRFCNNFIDTLLGCKLGEHLIKLVCIWIPIVFPKFQPFELAGKKNKFASYSRYSQKKASRENEKGDNLRLYLNAISKICICCQFLGISRT